MANENLVKFIGESRKRGFDDLQIKEPLLKHGWPLDEINKAFASLSKKQEYKFKNQISVFVSSDVLKVIEKRAKKNLLTVPEQIEDILRRSCIMSSKLKRQEEKLDDFLVSLFSRKRCGKKKK